MMVCSKRFWISHWQVRLKENVLSWRLKQLGLVSWRMFSSWAFHVCGLSQENAHLPDLPPCWSTAWFCLCYMMRSGICSLHWTADIPSRRRLRSSTSDDLFVPSLRLVSIGGRSFAAAATKLRNTLPDDITSAQYLFLFSAINWKQSYPDIILCCHGVVEVFYSGHLKQPLYM